MANLDIDKIKNSKVTIPIVTIVGAALIIWNLSGKFNQFQDSVATTDNISEVQDQHENDIDTLNSRINGIDKRIIIVEILSQIATGDIIDTENLGVKPQMIGPEPPPEEPDQQ